ncbi:MAG: Omp28-related outer membrane protein [Alloprevotella sp.]|nr:Omp28-related outer membrane protein [Alloprevotella sp.]
MKHSIRAYLFLISCMLGISLSAQTTLTLGYCPDNIDESAQTVTLNSGMEVRFRAASILPASRMKALKGAKLTKIRVGAHEGYTGWYVTLRSSLTGVALIKTVDIGTTVEGWNEVTLPEPFEITGEDLVLYYAGKMPAGGGLLTHKQSTPNGFYLYDGFEWRNYYDKDLGSLYLQAVIELEGDSPDNDLALESTTFNPVYAQIGEPVTASFRVANYGFTEADMPKLFYSINEAAPIEVPVEGKLQAGGFTELQATVATDACIEGHNSFRAWIKSNNPYTDNDSSALDLPCYEKAFAHKTLVEHFTTLPCPNCPAGANVLRGLLSGRTDYVWVAHHVGYQSDELTVNSSYEVSSPLGVVGAPFAAFDRTILDCSYSTSAPGFVIGYAHPAEGVEYLKPFFEQCVNVPALVSVNIDNDFDTETRLLTTTVKGERNVLFKDFYPDANLTVELVEDAVETVGKQSGNNSQIHDNVFRTALTPMFGSEPAWDSNAYSATYTFTVPEEWNADKLRVVAFINRPNKQDYSQIQVLNAEQQAVKDTEAGINDVVAVTETEARHEYFNLQGQRLSAPVKGVYLERITTPTGCRTVKRIR